MSLLSKLQRVMNTAARIVTLTPRFEPVTPILKELHWLKVPQRIDFKVLVLTFKALHGQAPIYLKDFLQPYKPARSLRSQKDCLLVLPRARQHRFGDRAFPMAAARLWNNLPYDTRTAASLPVFKKKLKTFLFSQQ